MGGGGGGGSFDKLRFNAGRTRPNETKSRGRKAAFTRVQHSRRHGRKVKTELGFYAAVLAWKKRKKEKRGKGRISSRKRALFLSFFRARSFHNAYLSFYDFPRFSFHWRAGTRLSLSLSLAMFGRNCCGALAATPMRQC